MTKREVLGTAKRMNNLQDNETFRSNRKFILEFQFPALSELPPTVTYISKRGG